jgi:uncharacterized cupredoxin-like copper-binding protein
LGLVIIAVAIAGVLTVPGGTAFAQVPATTAAFCQGRVDAGAAANLIFNGDKTAQATFAAALVRIQANAPAAAQADVAILVAAFKAKGVQHAFDDPAVQAAGDRLDAFIAANCGYQVVKATAIDYQFTGIPATLKAGPTVFSLTNGAPKEHHEMVLIRRKPGVTDAAAKLLALSQKKLAQKADFVDGTNETSPGQTSYAITTLTPGQYIVACFLPQNGKKKGKPHFLLGMVGEFAVS